MESLFNLWKLKKEQFHAFLVSMDFYGVCLLLYKLQNTEIKTMQSLSNSFWFQKSLFDLWKLQKRNVMAFCASESLSWIKFSLKGTPPGHTSSTLMTNSIKNSLWNLYSNCNESKKCDFTFLFLNHILRCAILKVLH